MKLMMIAAVCATTLAGISAPALAETLKASTALAASHATKIEEGMDPNLIGMEEIDHNAIADGAAADATVVDTKTVGKPRPKASRTAKVPREIPLIDTQHESKSSDDVTFVTGGIGRDERAAIEAAKADYNLHVTSAAASGEFMDDTRITITRMAGDESEEVLSVESGPLLYVRLPEGSYTLVAVVGAQTKEQRFVVNAKSKTTAVRLTWKSAE